MPILIPIKSYSKRCPNKNEYLLPYTAKYLEYLGLKNSGIVISDSERVLGLANELGLKGYLEIREDGQDELLSCWNFLKNISDNEFILCPVTQPFKDKALVYKMQNIYLSKLKFDFICSATYIPDRSRFYINEDTEFCTFKYKKGERKGALCNENLMLDGALYLIKKEYLKLVCKSKNRNTVFWKGRFTYVINNAPFIDIDTITDLEKFSFLRNYFKENI